MKIVSTKCLPLFLTKKYTKYFFNFQLSKTFPSICQISQWKNKFDRLNTSKVKVLSIQIAVCHGYKRYNWKFIFLLSSYIWAFYQEKRKLAFQNLNSIVTSYENPKKNICNNFFNSIFHIYKDNCKIANVYYLFASHIKRIQKKMQYNGRLLVKNRYGIKMTTKSAHADKKSFITRYLEQNKNSTINPCNFLKINSNIFNLRNKTFTHYSKSLVWRVLFFFLIMH